MMEDISWRVDRLETQVNSVQGEVNNMAIELAKLNLSVSHLETSSSERFKAQKIYHDELKTLLEQQRADLVRRDEESKSYRLAREDREASKQRWLQSIISPQTIIIILAIIAGMLGVRISDIGIP
tara:strand:+ start:366 stop:740 length:375 start_codon:yes stop_codon:yes gene_type:complete